MLRETSTEMSPDRAFRQTGGSKSNEHGETILLVEDDPSLLALTRDFLVGKGYHVLDAPGGEEAMKIAQEYIGPIHLLLTDLQMPRLNGWMLAKQLRPLRPETKVLFMSAYTSKLTDPRDFLGAPQITKPFRLEDLDHKVRETLGYLSPFARPDAREQRKADPQTRERR